MRFSKFYVLNHPSSNYREASCYSLYLFNPPEWKKKQSFHFPRLKWCQLSRSSYNWLSQWVDVLLTFFSLLLKWFSQTLKIASPCSAAIVWRENKRERKRRADFFICMSLHLCMCVWFVISVFHLIDESQIQLQSGVLVNRKDYYPTLRPFHMLPHFLL